MYSYSLNTNLETNTCISWVRYCHTQCYGSVADKNTNNNISIEVDGFCSRSRVF